MILINLSYKKLSTYRLSDDQKYFDISIIIFHYYNLKIFPYQITLYNIKILIIEI